MADLKKILKDTLGDDNETLSKIEEAIKSAGAKFTDLSEGAYVDKNKYSALEEKYNQLKDAPNPLEDELNSLKETSKNNLEAERAKLTGVVKEMAIKGAISKLGLTDDLAVAGINSLINRDKININENYEVVDGLDEQISSFKETYKTSFEKPTVVSTGPSVQTSATNGGQQHRYSSLAEIKALSQEQVAADLDNIMSQLGSLK